MVETLQYENRGSGEWTIISQPEECRYAFTVGFPLLVMYKILLISPQGSGRVGGRRRPSCLLQLGRPSQEMHSTVDLRARPQKTLAKDTLINIVARGYAAVTTAPGPPFQILAPKGPLPESVQCQSIHLSL